MSHVTKKQKLEGEGTTFVARAGGRVGSDAVLVSADGRAAVEAAAAGCLAGAPCAEAEAQLPFASVRTAVSPHGCRFAGLEAASQSRAPACLRMRQLQAVTIPSRRTPWQSTQPRAR